MANTYTGYGTGRSGLAAVENTLTGSEPAYSEIPGPVRKGVRFMLTGGALTVIVGIFLVIATIADKNVLTSGGKISTGEFASGVAWAAVTYVIQAVIWVVMARFNRAGRTWARILASVFCLIASFDTYRLINSLSGVKTLTVAEIVYIVFTLAIWIVGVLAIAMIWRSESGAYYRARSAALR